MTVFVTDTFMSSDVYDSDSMTHFVCSFACTCLRIVYICVSLCW